MIVVSAVTFSVLKPVFSQADIINTKNKQMLLNKKARFLFGCALSFIMV